MIKSVLYRLFRLLPIKKNRVLFLSYYGSQYGCNPKYISEYLVKEHADEVEITWAFSDPDRYELEKIRKVRYFSLKYFLMLATSRIIVTNYRMTKDFVKRSGQIYIQSWHSSLRLKKIEGDTEHSLPAVYIEMAKRDSAQTDYVIAGCRFSHKTFANSFWYNGNIIDAGTPRNDLLINHDYAKEANLRRQIVGDNNRHLILYAPTFRKDKSTDCYKVDFDRLRQSLSKHFGGDWIVGLRLHPHLLNCSLFNEIEGVINLTKYDDIQELLFVADALLTDYSSLMFDFAISGKPVFLYASDINDYCKNDRAFYFNIKDLPFALATDNEMLMTNIRTFDKSAYKLKIREFNNKIGSFETGNAARKVSEIILRNLTS